MAFVNRTPLHRNVIRELGLRLYGRTNSRPLLAKSTSLNTLRLALTGSFEIPVTLVIVNLRYLREWILTRCLVLSIPLNVIYRESARAQVI